MKHAFLQRLLVPLSLLFALALPAGATWSIVAVNRVTGEVAVASATCLVGFNLKTGVPVIVVGKGAAAAQSFIDLSGNNRKFIFDSFMSPGVNPNGILNQLARMDQGHQTRQYGIVALFGGPPVTFSGTRAGRAKAGVTGQIGDYVYAIQGNVLTSAQVIFAAETAFRDSTGDMGQRLMEAMHAARALGGDGRCSCLSGTPTSCGAPPPNFNKSAHVGVMVIARIGDTDGVCNSFRGCATGNYYYEANVFAGLGQVGSPDPVFTLQARYDNWRAAQAGRPDAVLSTVDAVRAVPADGLTQRTVTVQLVDIEGDPLTTGGATVVVSPRPGFTPLATLGPVVDNLDGSYSFTLTAGATPGNDKFEISVDDGGGPVVLFPFLNLTNDPVQPLHVGYPALSAAEGGESVPFQFNEPVHAGDRYLLIASLTGTQPGHMIRNVLLPLNPPHVSTVIGGIHEEDFPGAVGRLDERGRAAASLEIDAARMLSLVGQRIDVAGVLLAHDGLVVTNVVGLDITP